MRQIIFIHVPRTAGTSMERWAEGHCGSYQRERPDGWNRNVEFTSLDHRSASALMSAGVLTERWWNDSFKFAFVRNPWDRLVSLYEYLRSFRLKRKRRPSNKYLLSFGVFVEAVTDQSLGYVHPLGFTNVREFSQANPQVEWLRWGVDFVGRYELLDDHWRIVCRAAGWEHSSLPRVHVGKPRRSYRSYYTDASAEQVGEFYAEDVTRFGYRF